MDFDALFPGRFLKAGDLNGRWVTLLVSAVRLEDLEDDKGKRAKAILAFRGAKKELVLNRTNGLYIKAMFGRETDAWVGKRVTFWAAPNPDSKRGFGDEICVRVKGSPDIAANIAFDCKPGRKKAVRVTLVKVQLDAQGRTIQPAKSAAQVESDRALDELTSPADIPGEDLESSAAGKPTGVTSTGEPPPDVPLPT